MAAATLAGGALVLVGAARADTSTKWYALTATPAASAAAAGQQYTLTLQNCGGLGAPDCSPASAQTLGSANIAVPTDVSNAPAFGNISGLSVTASGGESWSACLGDGTTCGASPDTTLQLRAQDPTNAISPGESVSVSFTATATCDSAAYTWSSQVKQSNDFSGAGNDFTNAGSDPTTTVGSGPVDHFVIGLPTALFSATAGTPFAASITAVDSCGNTDTGFDGSGTLSSDLSASPNGTQPTVTDSTGGATTGSAFPATVSFDNGVSQPSVAAFDAESGKSLTFSAAGSDPVTTETFAVEPAQPDHVAFTGQPLVGGNASWLLNTGNALTQFGAQATIYDAYGNVATQEDGTAAAGQVALTLHQAGTSATLGGTTSVTPSAGVATFTDLTVSGTNVGYTITAAYTAGVKKATSDPFSVYLTLNDCANAGTQCGIPQFNVDPSTTTQVQGNGAFAFLGVATVPFAASGVPAGCQTFAQDATGSAPVVVIDQRSSLSGDLSVTYGINKKLIAKKYGNTNGQQFIPLCVGARRIAYDAQSGKTYPVPCDQLYDGQTQTPWVGKTLDSTGRFNPKSLSPAICDSNPADPGYGYFWGIAGSFQDYTASNRSLRIDPSANPTVTTWTSDTTYRYFTLRFPSGSGSAGSFFAGVPWDGYCGG